MKNLFLNLIFCCFDDYLLFLKRSNILIFHVVLYFVSLNKSFSHMSINALTEH